MKVSITYDDTLYQLVPKEPTDKMVQSAHHLDLSYMPGQEGSDRAAIYRAMLSAAPTPPAQPKQPPGFHNCTFSNEPVQTVVVIAGESAQTPAQPAERKPQEWMPIETVPKDGMPILGYRDGNIARCYQVLRDDCEMWVFGNRSGACEYFPEIKPTHWMPLPAPPGNGIKGES